MKNRLFIFFVVAASLIGCIPTSTPNKIIPPDPTTPTINETTKATPTKFTAPTFQPRPTAITPGTILFNEDFESKGLQNFSYLFGNWSIVTDSTGNHVLEVDTRDDVETNKSAAIGFGSLEWGNYSADYQVRMLNGKANTSLNFRSTMNNENYYVQWLSMEYQTLNLRINILNKRYWDKIAEDKKYPVGLEVWYRIRIEAEGSKIDVYVNDALIISAEDSSISNGGFDLGVMPGTHAQFDNIRVTAK